MTAWTIFCIQFGFVTWKIPLSQNMSLVCFDLRGRHFKRGCSFWHLKTRFPWHSKIVLYTLLPKPSNSSVRHMIPFVINHDILLSFISDNEVVSFRTCSHGNMASSHYCYLYSCLDFWDFSFRKKNETEKSFQN